MNHISAERFLSLDKKVQDKIIDWWTPSKFDFVYDVVIEQDTVITSCDYEVYYLYNHGNVCYRIKNRLIPLLTETQLRTYIENTIKSGVNIRCDEDGYVMSADKYIACSEDLLECYLDIAVKVS